MKFSYKNQKMYSVYCILTFKLRISIFFMHYIINVLIYSKYTDLKVKFWRLHYCRNKYSSSRPCKCSYSIDLLAAVVLDLHFGQIADHCIIAYNY